MKNQEDSITILACQFDRGVTRFYSIKTENQWNVFDVSRIGRLPNGTNRVFRISGSVKDPKLLWKSGLMRFSEMKEARHCLKRRIETDGSDLKLIPLSESCTTSGEFGVLDVNFRGSDLWETALLVPPCSEKIFNSCLAVE